MATVVDEGFLEGHYEVERVLDKRIVHREDADDEAETERQRR